MFFILIVVLLGGCVHFYCSQKVCLIKRMENEKEKKRRSGKRLSVMPHEEVTVGVVL